MLSFLKKDLLLILRDRGELLLLLGMPMLLIAILGFALGGMMDGGADSPIHVNLGVVVEDDAAAGRAAFREQLQDSDIPALQRTGLLFASQAVDPLAILDDFLSSPDLAELLTVHELPAAEAATMFDNGGLQAVVTVPAGFSASLYGRMFLESGDSARLLLELGDGAPLGASVVKDLLSGFAEEFSLQTALQQVRAGQSGGFAPPALPAANAAGGTEVIGSSDRSVSSFAYYAVGMAVMFVLFLVGNTAQRAFLELDNFSFNRILMSGARPLSFLASKVLTVTMVGFVQMMLLLLGSQLLFGAFRGQPVSFWLEAALIAAVTSLAVGGLAALVTALVFRSGNRGLADAFNSIIVFVFALLGGSFIPLGGSLIARIGEWTPNGAGLSALLSAAQGAGAAGWSVLMIRMLLVAAVLLAAGLLIFPRSRSN